MLKGIHLNAPFQDLPGNIAYFYNSKIDLHQNMIDMAAAFLSGPKPGVDYGKMTAEAPKITASLEYVDRTLFQATPLIFATLIDQHPDKNGHASHLMITTAERKGLLRSLAISFGKQMDVKEANYIVSSASVLRDYLMKYQCANEP